MIPDWILACLPSRKPCGCPKGEEPGHAVAEAKFDSKMVTHSVGGTRHDLVVMHCHCESCGGDYTMTWAWVGLGGPHPDWREWTATEMVEKTNKMGEERTERVRKQHPDYTRAFDWCRFDHINRMWNGDRDPDQVHYGEWDGELNIEVLDDE